MTLLAAMKTVHFGLPINSVYLPSLLLYWKGMSTLVDHCIIQNVVIKVVQEVVMFMVVGTFHFR